jgi:hypothetical protein
MSKQPEQGPESGPEQNETPQFVKVDDAQFIARLIVKMGEGETAGILESAKSFPNGTGGQYFAALASLTYNTAHQAALEGTMTWQTLAMSTVTDAFNTGDRMELADGIVKVLTLFSAWFTDLLEKNPELKGFYEGVLKGVETE